MSVSAEAELHLSAPPSVQLMVAKVAAVVADFHVESAEPCAKFRQFRDSYIFLNTDF